ncbi:MAG: L,D-transpeptidase family protein [Myxococcota bacterium]
MRTELGIFAAACLWLAACDRAEPRASAEPAPARAPVVPSVMSVADSTPVSPVASERPPESSPPSKPAGSEPAGSAEPEPELTLAQIEPELEIPQIPAAPEDYGLLELVRPPPPQDELVMHALAGYEVVAIYSEPDIDSPKLGYLRLGTRLKVTKKLGTTGCAKGWHALPTGGFACASKGLVVDAKRAPYLHRPPSPPRMEEALPYRYAYVRRWNSPMWWRIPTAQEQAEADAQRAVREATREGKPLPGEPSNPTVSTPTAQPAQAKPAQAKPAQAKPAQAEPDLGASPPSSETSLPSVTDDVASVESAGTSKPASASGAKVEPVQAPAASTGKTEPAPEPEPEPEPIKLPLNPQDPWLEKGFFISLADKITEEGKSWWYTSRGAYVEAKAAYEYQPKDFSGALLSEESGFPFGYAMVKEAKIYELDADGGLKVTGKLERRTFVDLSEEIEISGKAYMMTPDGGLLRKKELRLAEPQPVPEGIEPWERWIDVSLSKQMLVAYEGSRPVYVTLVSTGRKGTEEEPFETPPGRYRIRSKHVSSTMDGMTASDGNYSIQDVPWAMFFEGSYALHGAFWHNSFGRVRSHGCVNLGASDARWLFMWTTPFLPEGWHGVHAHEGSPGTTVIVRE